MTNESASQQLGLKMTSDNSTDDHRSRHMEIMKSLHAHVNKIHESSDDVICSNSLKRGKAMAKMTTNLYIRMILDLMQVITENVIFFVKTN